jgi:hypothetical protein
MKKVVIGLACLTILTAPAFAGMDNIVSKIKRDGLSYGIPCLASYGLSLALLKDKQFEIGTIACAASASVNYFRIQDRQLLEDKFSLQNKEQITKIQTELKDSAFKNVKDQMVSDIHAEVYVKVEESLLKDSKFKTDMMAGLTKELKEYKSVIDNVLALKLSEFKGEIPKSIEAQLMNGPFLKLVEEKVNKSFKDKFSEAIDLKKDEIVKQCVSEALDEIIVKQVGAKDAGMKTLENR